jgi:fructokinase
VKFRVIGIGEILWDLLPHGRQLGGAPANFVYHARALGAEARLVSRVGRDSLGQETLERLLKLGLPTELVEVDDAAPTGTVTVALSSDGQPRFSIHEDVAWDFIRASALAYHAVADAHAVCLGTLAQRREPARSAIRSLVRAAPSSALRILDVNLRPPYIAKQHVEESLALANVLKLNEAELPQLAEMFALEGDERSQMTRLAERFDLDCVAYTRGADGSLIYAKGRWSEHPGVRANVVDTVGAGDAFTAAMTLGLLNGWDLHEVSRHANELAAWVASNAGATPPLPEELCAVFGRDNAPNLFSEPIKR